MPDNIEIYEPISPKRILEKFTKEKIHENIYENTPVDVLEQAAFGQDEGPDFSGLSSDQMVDLVDSLPREKPVTTDVAFEGFVDDPSPESLYEGVNKMTEAFGFDEYPSYDDPEVWGKELDVSVDEWPTGHYLYHTSKMNAAENEEDKIYHATEAAQIASKISQERQRAFMEAERSRQYLPESLAEMEAKDPAMQWSDRDLEKPALPFDSDPYGWYRHLRANNKLRPEDLQRFIGATRGFFGKRLDELKFGVSRFLPAGRLLTFGKGREWKQEFYQRRPALAEAELGNLPLIGSIPARFIAEDIPGVAASIFEIKSLFQLIGVGGSAVAKTPVAKKGVDYLATALKGSRLDTATQYMPDSALFYAKRYLGEPIKRGAHLGTAGFVRATARDWAEGAGFTEGIKSGFDEARWFAAVGAGFKVATNLGVDTSGYIRTLKHKHLSKFAKEQEVGVNDLTFHSANATSRFTHLTKKGQWRGSPPTRTPLTSVEQRELDWLKGFMSHGTEKGPVKVKYAAKYGVNWENDIGFLIPEKGISALKSAPKDIPRQVASDKAVARISDVASKAGIDTRRAMADVSKYADSKGTTNIDEKTINDALGITKGREAPAPSKEISTKARLAGIKTGELLRADQMKWQRENKPLTANDIQEISEGEWHTGEVDVLDIKDPSPLPLPPKPEGEGWMWSPEDNALGPGHDIVAHLGPGDFAKGSWVRKVEEPSKATGQRETQHVESETPELDTLSEQVSRDTIEALASQYGIDAVGKTPDELLHNLLDSQRREVAPDPHQHARPLSEGATSGFKQFAQYDVPIDMMNLDPARFQHRLRYDERGVTDKLDAEEEWKPRSAAPLTLWRDPEGTLWVTDGHHRAVLANRLIKEGNWPDDKIPNKTIPSYVLDSADGWTEEMAMAEGALRNIDADSVDPWSVAKAIRNTGMTKADLRDRGMTFKKKLVKDGWNMSQLKDEAWSFATTTPEMNPTYAGLVGELMPESSADLQIQALKEVLNPTIKNDYEAKSTILNFKEAPTVTKRDMFGGVEVSLSNLKGKIQEGVMAGINKGMYGALSEGKIQAANQIGTTKIDAEEHRLQKSDLKIIKDTLDRTFFVKGPISDVVNEGIKLYEQNKTEQGLKDAVKYTIDELQKIDVAKSYPDLEKTLPKETFEVPREIDGEEVKIKITTGVKESFRRWQNYVDTGTKEAGSQTRITWDKSGTTETVGSEDVQDTLRGDIEKAEGNLRKAGQLGDTSAGGPRPKPQKKELKAMWENTQDGQIYEPIPDLSSGSENLAWVNSKLESWDRTTKEKFLSSYHIGDTTTVGSLTTDFSGTQLSKDHSIAELAIRIREMLGHEATGNVIDKAFESGQIRANNIGKSQRIYGDRMLSSAFKRIKNKYGDPTPNYSSGEIAVSSGDADIVDLGREFPEMAWEEAGDMVIGSPKLPGYRFGQALPGKISAFKPDPAYDPEWMGLPPSTEVGGSLIEKIKNDAEGQKIGMRSIIRNLYDHLGTELRIGPEQLTKSHPAHYEGQADMVRDKSGVTQYSFHEAGHAIRRRISLANPEVLEGWEDDLLEIAGRPDSAASALNLSEGFAEWTRRYVSLPSTVRNLSVTSSIEEYMRNSDPELLDALRDTSRAFRAHVNRGPKAMFRSVHHDLEPMPSLPSQLSEMKKSFIQSAIAGGYGFQSFDEALRKLLKDTVANEKTYNEGLQALHQLQKDIEGTPGDMNRMYLMAKGAAKEADSALSGWGTRITSPGMINPEARDMLVNAGFNVPDDVRFGDMMKFPGATGREIFKEIGHKQFPEFEDYLAAKSSLARAKAKGLEYPGETEGISKVDLQEMVEEWEGAHPKWIELADNVTEFFDNLLMIDVLGGLKTPAEAVKMKETYDYYSPLIRGANPGIPWGKVKEAPGPSVGPGYAKGSPEAVQGLLESMVQRAHKTFQAYYDNQAMMSPYRLAQDIERLDYVPREVKDFVWRTIRPLRLEERVVGNLDSKQAKEVLAETANDAKILERGLVRDIDQLRSLKLDSREAYDGLAKSLGDEYVDPYDLNIAWAGKPVWDKVEPKGSNIVAGSENGEYVFFQINDMTLYRSMIANKQSPSQFAQGIEDLLGAGSRAWGGVIVHLPGFPFKNIGRDVLTTQAPAIGKTGESMIPGSHHALGVAHSVFKKDELTDHLGELLTDMSKGGLTPLDKMKRSGISQVLRRNVVVPGWKEMPLGRKLLHTPGIGIGALLKPADIALWGAGFEKAARISEKMPRTGAAIAKKKAGGTDIEAIDAFQRSTGTYIERPGNADWATILHSLRFVGPKMQQAFMQLSVLNDPDPVRRAYNWSRFGIIAMQTAAKWATRGLFAYKGGKYVYNAINRDDEQEYIDGTKDWEKEARPVHRTFRYVWNGIQMPFAFGPEGAVEMATWLTLDRIAENNPVPTDELMREVFLKTLPLPDGASQLMSPYVSLAMELATNHSFFRGEMIEPQYMERLPTEERAYPGTPKIYRDMARWTGISPLRLQHAVKGGARPYDTVIEGLDIAAKIARGETVEWPDVPELGRFIPREPRGWGSHSVKQVMDIDEEFSRVDKQVNLMRERGEDVPDSLERQRRELAPVRSMSRQLRRLGSSINNIRDEIERSRRRGEKGERLRELQREIRDRERTMTRIAREWLEAEK